MWTTNQTRVINSRDRNLLVSAAAGSGKTAVLVEHIISMIIDSDNPLDVDKLLVVTFTKAAAAEMRERVMLAIEKEAKEQPQNEHLQKQLVLIHNANITTIDSFCQRLVKENFDKVDVDPGFRIGDEGELALLRADTIAEILEEYYVNGEEEFLEFIDSYSKKTDDGIENMIEQIYRSAMSHPYPQKWLNDCVKNYQFENKEDIYMFSWFKYISKYINNELQAMYDNLVMAQEIIAKPDGPFHYAEMINDDLSKLNALIVNNSINKRKQILENLEFMRLSTKRPKDIDDAKKVQVKAIRDEVKKTLIKFTKKYYSRNEDEIFQDMSETSANAIVLIELVKDFIKTYADNKKEENILDFNDIEHLALQILVSFDENGDYVITDTAKEMSNQYKEIMIDEYQDSNLVQEIILSSISKQYRGEPNMFMVGDVKQSIYKFRLSRPELFMDKYNRYSVEDNAKEQRITLDKNFRSRDNVLSSINMIFEQIMQNELGGIEYDADNALYTGAEYYPALGEEQSNATEFILVETDSKVSYEDVEGEDEQLEMAGIELEAKAISSKIREMMDFSNPFLVTDKKSGELRPAKYKDIVILLRSTKDKADIYVETLNNDGVPAYTESKAGYFGAYEIVILLNLLSIIDNPLQDIPVVSVLKSPIIKLNEEDMARIKVCMGEEKMHFYLGILKYIEQGSEQELIIKLRRFVEKLEDYRVNSTIMSIYELIEYILEDTKYYYYVKAMPAGDKRAANVEMLKQKAIEYENTSYVGLFNFVRYIEKLKKYEVDYGEASILNESADVVRVMTIHGSKGLEFPIVIVANINKGFNFMDSRSEIVTDQDFGIGLVYRNSKNRIKDNTILHQAIATKNIMDTMGEELRILYVALTRAKEKLILTGVVKDLEKQVNKWMHIRESEVVKIPITTLTGVKSYLDWIGLSLIRNRAFNTVWKANNIDIKFANPIYDYDTLFEVKIIPVQEIVDNALQEKVSEMTTREVLENWDTKHVYNKDIRNVLEEQLSYCYPYEMDSNIHTKMSVTELKKAHMQEDFDSQKLFVTRDTEIVPEFIAGKEELQGASRGTAYHRVFELLSYDISHDQEGIQAFLNKLVEKSLISTQMKDVIEWEKIKTFLDSDLCKRMKIADKLGQLHREQPFVIGIPAPGHEQRAEEEREYVLVQGIIDVYFEEEGELVIADYKTDNVRTMDELHKRYDIQLDYYRQALEQITRKKVKEAIIYATEVTDK